MDMSVIPTGLIVHRDTEPHGDFSVERPKFAAPFRRRAAASFYPSEKTWTRSRASITAGPLQGFCTFDRLRARQRGVDAETFGVVGGARAPPTRNLDLDVNNWNARSSSGGAALEVVSGSVCRGLKVLCLQVRERRSLAMNEDRNQDRTPKQQAHQKHPDEWQRDLNPNHLAGQNIGSDALDAESPHLTAFHLRKRGHEFGGLDDNDLKQVPLLPEGTRLQQGATYVNLAEGSPQEFTATANVTAQPGDAYAPKDRVPYEVWNRLIGEPKPGQE
jgi:hypothetical protein